MTTHNGHTRIPNFIWSMNLPAPAGWIYTAIRSFTRPGKKWAYPSQIRLSKMTGLDGATISKWVKYLEKRGVLFVKRARGKRNIYIFLDKAPQKTQAHPPDNSGTVPPKTQHKEYVVVDDVNNHIDGSQQQIELTAFGVDCTKLSKPPAQFPLALVQQNIAYAKKATGLSNPPGWVKSQLEANKPPPSKQKRDAFAGLVEQIESAAFNTTLPDDAPPPWERKLKQPSYAKHRAELIKEYELGPIPILGRSDAWEIAHNQLEIQFDRASFDTWLKGITAIGYNPEKALFVLGVKNKYALDMLQHRLYRNVCRVLSDSYGQDIEIEFVLLSKDKPTPQGEKQYA